MKQKIDFERFYEKYGEHWVNKSRRKYEKIASNWKVGKILTVLNQNKSIKVNSLLDFGCGPGNILSFLDKKMNLKRVYGFDISKSMIKIARKNFPKAKYIISKDLADFSNKVDLVIFIDVLEHVPEPIKILKQASKISKYQFVKIPLENTLLRNMAKFIGLNKVSSEGHINFWHKDEFLDLLDESGFKVIDFWEGNPPKKIQFYPRESKGEVSKIKKPLFLVFDITGKIIFPFHKMYAYLFSSNLFVLVEKNETHPIKPPTPQ